MEPLWSPVVANAGNRRQICSARTRLKQAKTIAVGCDRLRPGPHGKEGVDGSSPSEGSAKNLLTAFFISDCFADARMWGRYRALYGAFRSKTPVEGPAFSPS